MQVPAATLALALLALPAHAACQGQQVFACDIGSKSVEVCLTPTDLTYSYGPTDAPELSLTAPITEAAYTPWPGVGSSIWETVAFQNEGVTYEVWFNADRMTDEHPITGGVRVMQGDATVAELACAKDSVRSGLDLIYGAKEAAGQCWDRAEQVWAASCPEE